MAEPAPASAPEAAASFTPVPVEAEPPAERWSAPRRFGLRFAFCLAFLLYVPFPLSLIPFADKVTGPLEEAEQAGLRRLTVALLHPPPEQLPERTGSGDTLMGFVRMGAAVALALAAGAAWMALDRRRRYDRALSAWLNLGLRWALFSTMLVYGFSKVFPLQMPWDEARLVEPLGEFSPMGLVWTFMGASAPYEALAGWAEVIGGVLLVWRRTAGVGALLLLGVMGNVMAMNYLYDVPVKLFSTQLWLTGVYLAAPDGRRLFRLLVLQKPTEPAVEVPLLRWERLRRHRWVIPALIVALAGWQVFSNLRGVLEFRGRLAEMVDKDPLRGPYQVESFTAPASPAANSPLAGPAWARLSGSHGHLGVLRADGSFLHVFATPAANGALKLSLIDSRDAVTEVRFERLDAEHVRLAGGGFEAKLAAIPRSSFMLLRGYHWVQPKPVNR